MVKNVKKSSRFLKSKNWAIEVKTANGKILKSSIADKSEVKAAAGKILEKHDKAFHELSKR